MNKKFSAFLSLILSAIFVLSGCFVALADNSTEEKAERPNYKIVAEGGVVNLIPYDENGNEIKPGIKNHLVGTQASLPATYDLRKENRVTSVKDQGVTGTCWAHGSINSMESNYITKGMGTVSDTNFSESHLTWFSYSKDPEKGDGIVQISTGSSEYQNPYSAGGSWKDSAVPLSNWWGAELDKNAPLDYKNLSNNGNLPESQRTASYIHLENAINYASDQQESIAYMDAIKSHIIEKGALAIEFNSDRSNLNGYAYYQDETTVCDHAVSLIGWDDNYSKNNFKSATGTKPSENGAWLIKNSYGTDYADNGYFWLSYYDTAIQNIVGYEVAEVTNYDTVHSYNGYDPGGYYYYSSRRSLKYANVFVAEGKESLEAVGLWVAQPDIGYEIKIYRGLSSSVSNPETGTLVSECTTSGNIPFVGFYTIDLKEGVSLNKGEKYSVVVSIKANSDDFIYIPFEKGDWSFKEFDVTYKRNRGESFLYVNSWFDSADAKNKINADLHNAMLSVYTYSEEPADASEFTYTVDNGKVTITGYKGNRIRLTIPDSIDGNPVTSIANSAFYKGEFTRIVLPETLQSISDHAFNRCNEITEIVIPASVTSIGKQAFSDCQKLSKVVFADEETAVSIGNFAFLNCPQLKEITMISPNVSIGTRAFGYAYDYTAEKYSVTNLTIRGYSETPAHAYYLENDPYVKWYEIPVYPVSLSIIQKPNKTSYDYKESNNLNLDGLKVEVTYSSGKKEIITDTSMLEISGYNSRSTGTQTITVQYGDCRDTFTVSVSYTTIQLIIVIFLFGWLWY